MTEQIHATQPALPTHVDQLIHAGWVLAGGTEKPLLPDHSIAVHEGRIVDILPTAGASEFYRATSQTTLPDCLLMPGLVNAHGHAAMTLLRGAADDLPLHTWLEDHIWPMEGRWVSEEFVEVGTRLAIAEMLLGGTTCFADMYFFPETTARVAKEIGIRAQLACPVFDFPSAWGANADDYIDKTTRLNDHYRHDPLISVAFGPHAPYTVSDAPLKKIAILAEEMDVPIHMHVHETAQEVTDAVAASGMRPLQRLAGLGLLTPRLLCVHATQLEDDEISLLAECGASVVHCPESNLKLASGFCRSAALLEAGVNVALGTDGAASNNDLDMLSELRSAALLAKATAADACAVPAAVALQMATLNGARAMGLDIDTGSLEVGKAADIAAIDLSGFNTLPLYNPLSQLVYSSNSRQVSHVWVAGRLLVDNGRLTTIDTDRLQADIRLWQQRIQQEQS